MSSRTVYRPTTSSSSRTLHSVQRVLRALIWFGLFFLLGIITLIVAFLLSMVADFLGYLAIVVGGFLTLVIPGMVSHCLYVIPEFERVVVLKMGKFIGVKGPGNFWVIPYPPCYQSVAAKLDMRVQTRVITAAETLTADNVPVGCEAVIFWRVEDPQRAALQVANYTEAVFQAANSALKDTVGTLELTDLLGKREKVSHRLKEIIDAAAASFGVDVSSVEITDIHVPTDLIQELSVLAQSRRAAQAKIAEAGAEKAIAQKLQEASSLMGSAAMEMYRLNVLERIGREEGSQIVVYGLGSSDTFVETTIAATAAGSQLHKPVPKTKIKPAPEQHPGE
jgi:regulator of protease activity HflC (stomatin/prohibitin superfamily)